MSLTTERLFSIMIAGNHHAYNSPCLTSSDLVPSTFDVAPSIHLSSVQTKVFFTAHALLEKKRIVPHCFSREQGGKKHDLDLYIWQAYPCAASQCPYMASIEPPKGLKIGFFQWRGGKPVSPMFHAELTVTTFFLLPFEFLP